MIACKGCKQTGVRFEDPFEDDYCVNCTEKLIERSVIREDWSRFHDEPFPEGEMPEHLKLNP